jgi:hypothetical protein
MSMQYAQPFSCEVRIWTILTAKADSPRRLDELKEIVLKVHATLQQMSEQTRTHSHGPKLSKTPRQNK